MVIRQGEVYWAELDEPSGSEPSGNRPYVVVQNNVFNESRMKTVLLCTVISTLRRGQDAGNVPLNTGEANLPKPSVVVVSQIVTLDKSQLGEYIGKLSKSRIRQILDGLQLLTEPRDAE